MKRIFSKKSGFTLVEIIVAFAIFAIMSTMILSMVQLTVEQRNINARLSENLANDNEYLAGHYISDADGYDTTETKSGTFRLDFGDTVDVEANLDYQMRANPSYTSEAGGVNYFVGDTKYAGVNDIDDSGSNDPVEGFGNQQDSRYETWIAGTRDLEYVKIWAVQKDTTYTGTGVRYFIKCSASASTVDEEYQPYAQYRLAFRMPDSKTVTRKEADGKTYEYEIKYNAQILDYGYNNGDSLTWTASCVSYTDHVPRSGYAKNQFLVEKTSAHTLHITAPFRVWNKADVTRFTGSNITSIWVVFAEDPQLTVDSFGENGTVDGSGRKFTQYPIYDEDGDPTGEYNLNLYGVHELPRTEVT